RAAATCLTHHVMRGDELLCSGDVTAAFLDMEGRPRRQSKIWHDRFTTLMQQAANS
ncbi:MAG: tol-pal system-associated acyl-CoA thioesterase, partial [Pseudomonadota bacterium]